MNSVEYRQAERVQKVWAQDSLVGPAKWGQRVGPASGPEKLEWGNWSGANKQYYCWSGQGKTNNNTIVAQSLGVLTGSLHLYVYLCQPDYVYLVGLQPDYTDIM